VFFTNVVVPADNLVGEMNAGWQIAQTTLSYERGGDTLSLVAHHQETFAQLLKVARMLRRDGTRAIDDPLIRQKLGQIYAEIEVLRYASLRILSGLEKGRAPGPESSIAKLHYSEMDKRVQEVILDILGPYGQQIDGGPPEFSLEGSSFTGEAADWAYFFVFSRAGTIYSGSSEIQKNIIGERVLGLPKEIRADRILARQPAG
jgi:alkylation response protein AidB-like acyl-CoA dehydrogenase